VSPGRTGCSHRNLSRPGEPKPQALKRPSCKNARKPGARVWMPMATRPPKYEAAPRIEMKGLRIVGEGEIDDHGFSYRYIGAIEPSPGSKSSKYISLKCLATYSYMIRLMILSPTFSGSSPVLQHILGRCQNEMRRFERVPSTPTALKVVNRPGCIGPEVFPSGSQTAQRRRASHSGQLGRSHTGLLQFPADRLPRSAYPLCPTENRLADRRTG
jgi:hypothetical protein